MGNAGDLRYLGDTVHFEAVAPAVVEGAGCDAPRPAAGKRPVQTGSRVLAAGEYYKGGAYSFDVQY